MDYSNMSVFDFCAEIYDLYSSDFRPYNISSVDMYNYLKKKTNNFDIESFGYAIYDIRNFVKYVEFEFENPDERPELVIDNTTGYPTNASSEAHYLHEDYIVRNITNLPGIYSVYEDTFFQFKDEESLRERVSKFNLIPQIKNICHDISNLLRFSDIAEKEYQKAIEKKEQNNLPLYNENFSIYELNSREFIEYCMKHEVPQLEMYDFIQKKTDNFDSNKTELFINELYRFNERIHIYITEDREYDGMKHTEEFNYYLLGYLRSYMLKNKDNPDAKEIIDHIENVLENSDLKTALLIARKINPRVRTGLEYHSFTNILYILENNVKEESDINIQPQKIQTYYDLTLQEFLDLITDKKTKYELKITPEDKNEEPLIAIGTEEQILSTIESIETTAYKRQRLIKKLESLKRPIYDKELSEIEIYNYLSRITDNFNPDKCAVIYNDIEVYYHMEFLERIESESFIVYKNNNWEIPYITTNDFFTKEEFVIPDYKKMRNKTHPADGFFIVKCLNLLKSKFPPRKRILKKEIKDTLKQPSLSEIALICYYQNIHVDKQSAKDVLEKFNVNATEKSLIEQYNKFQKKSNRTYSKTQKANEHHCKRLETVVKYLKENKLPSEEAENDLKVFLENMEN